MIQIYNPNNHEFMMNGDMVLQPIEAFVHPVLNGAWDVQLVHPIDQGGRWKSIIEDAVVKMPSYNGEQLFRIVKKEKRDSGIHAVLQPVFMDARNDCFIINHHIENKTGQEALDIMLDASAGKYTASSDIQTRSTAYYETMNFIEALNGNCDQSFIRRWGGEIEFDNFHITVNNKIGKNRGVQILYGKNIKEDGFQEDVSMADIVTRIIPKSYNGHMINSNQPWIDSPIVGKYQTVHTRTMKFDDVKMIEDAQDDDEEKGIIVCRTQHELENELKKKCEEQFANGIDKPAVTLTIDLVLLEDTDLYRDVKKLEKIEFGDTVLCRHSKLEIESTARVVDLVYNCLTKKVESVKIGDFQKNFFNDVASSMNSIDKILNPDGTVMGEQIAGIINGVNAQMKAQSTAAKPAKVIATLYEDLNPDSDTYGAMCLGTMGFMIASERLPDNSDWKWTTFGTGQGFYADCIVAGTMLADRIQGGTLTIGGMNDEAGRIRILDRAGKAIGSWTSSGLVTSTSDYSRFVRLDDGEIKIENKNGEVVARIWAVSNKQIRIDTSDGTSILLGNGLIDLSGNLYADGLMGRSGTAEFSDGTSLRFKNGILIGGVTKEGGF